MTRSFDAGPRSGTKTPPRPGQPGAISEKELNDMWTNDAMK